MNLLDIRIPSLCQYSHTLKRQTLWELGHSVFPKVYCERESVTVLRRRGGGGNLFIILIYFFLARTIWKNVFCIPALKSPRSSSRKEDAYPWWDVLSLFSPILYLCKLIRGKVLWLCSCGWLKVYWDWPITTEQTIWVADNWRQQLLESANDMSAKLTIHSSQTGVTIFMWKTTICLTYDRFSPFLGNSRSSLLGVSSVRSVVP